MKTSVAIVVLLGLVASAAAIVNLNSDQVRGKIPAYNKKADKDCLGRLFGPCKHH